MRRITLLISVLVPLLTVFAGPATARSPHQVDADSVMPPLIPALAPTCWETGSGVICEGSLEESYTNEDFGFRCGDQVVWVTGTLSDRLTRWHLPDGRATKTYANQTWRETWSLSLDGSGPSIEVTSRSIRHYTYLVPGDLTQRQLTETGATQLATAPGVGIVFRDAGMVVYEVGAANEFQNPIDLRGPHDTWTDWDAALAAACDVLEG